MSRRSLPEVFTELSDALSPLGIDLDRSEVLARWQFHARHGHQPLPPAALRHLASVIEELLADESAAPRKTTGGATPAGDG